MAVSNELSGKRVAFLVANQGVEQVELTSPWRAVQDAGGEPVLIAPEKESVQAVNGDIEKGDTFDPDLAVGDASADDFDALILPGGVANPDKLRMLEQAVAFANSFEIVQRLAAGNQVVFRDDLQPINGVRLV